MSRSYVVLRLNGETWEQIGRFDANGSPQAIREAAENNGAGGYVAIPAHNWNYVNVTVDQPPPRIRLAKEREP